MERIGIFGGSFNPVHHGHLLAARAAREALGLDRLFFVPCNASAYGKPLLEGRLRLAMLRAALKAEKGFEASDLELKRPGVSRSIDTLRCFKKSYGRGARFYLLIGQDQVAEFPAWKEAEALSKLAQVCVLARPLNTKHTKILKKFGLRELEIPQYEISSTEIRKRLKKNLSVAWLLPPQVLKVLMANLAKVQLI
jgi:nicotinate-nucleotide adenylyltransferase